MLNLFDYIEKDLPTIESYIGAFGVPLSVYVGSDEYFKYWAKCNKSLFHLLGGKLIVEREIEIEKNKDIVEQEISNFCKEYRFFTSTITDFFWDFFDYVKNDKIRDIRENNEDYYWMLRDSISKLFAFDSVSSNVISETLYYFNTENDKKMKLDKGTKTMKVIKKVIDFYGWGERTIPMERINGGMTINDAFEQYRIRHSQILNDKMMKGTLCLSIHPLDYMTMSDNSYSWSSCMNWKEGGCYHAGTVEMMNSNNVICAYLKGAEPYEWTYKGETYQWNNKKWRQLFYATKEIIVSGKAYPYANKELTYYILETLRDLAKENWNHTYQFGIEPYRDMIHITSIFKMANNKTWIKRKQTEKKNILFHSKGMYNDMLNDNRTAYYCVRNKVKKNTIITYSGKCPCISCGGDNLEENYEIGDIEYNGGSYHYNDRYENVGGVVCNSCRTKKLTCDYCGSIPSSFELYKFPNGLQLCGYCARENISAYCPCCGEMMMVNGYGDTYHSSKEDPKYRRFVIYNFNDPLIPIKQEYINYMNEHNRIILCGRDNCDFFVDINYNFKCERRTIMCNNCFDKIINNEDIPRESIRFNHWASDGDIVIFKVNEEIMKPYLAEGFEYKHLFRETLKDFDMSTIDLDSLRVY